MLANKDRIFTNLYGQHDWRLDGARRGRDFAHATDSASIASRRPET